jgi:thiosulfate/3-mercaptopyruvate sulfurtransferase
MANDSTAPLITAAGLASLLADPATALALLDVRWRLGGPPGIDLYRAGHIPGAVFVDLDRDLAAPPGPGGRHPMPATADFEAAMRRAGVSDGRPVVIYDDADSTAAARAWWLLRYFGHPAAAVLDGGYRAWTAAGHPVLVTRQTPPAGGIRPPATAPPPAAVTRSATGTPAGDFTARPGHMPLLDADGAAALARTGLLLDARAGERYRGETEPVDPVAGHIPGAVSAPTADNVSPDGTFRPVGDLAARFAALGAAGPTSASAASAGSDPSGSDPSDSDPSGAGVPGVGVYCGSGITAAHEVLALTRAGIPAALYLGSWSNWITDPARPIATGPAPG